MACMSTGRRAVLTGCRRSTREIPRDSKAGSMPGVAWPACATAAPAGRRAWRALKRLNPAPPFTSWRQMAIHSKLRKTAPPDGGGVASHPRGGSTMLWKLGVAVVLAIIAAVVPALSSYWPWVLVIGVVAAFIIEGVRIVPQQSAWVVERLGRYQGILEPGLNLIIPFLDRVAYVHSPKEVPLDVPEQVCITKDNTQLGVDGILYYQVTDPRLASYGSSNYIAAISQLAQTTLRNEIKSLTPPEAILRSMQQQITAEREKRALIAKSEGERQQEINVADGEKQAAVLRSEGEKQAAINRAQGEATAIRVIAEATAAGVRAVADAIGDKGGMDAANLKVAQQYVEAFANLAKTSNTLIVPTTASDVAGFVATAMTVLDRARPAKAQAT